MVPTLRNTVLIVAAMLVALASAVAADAPLLRSGKEVKWGAPPPSFPPGAKFAVIAGDPGASGLVTVRFEMPAGYTIAPHFHPTDEHVTVLKGSFSLCVHNRRRDHTGAHARTVRDYLRQSCR